MNTSTKILLAASLATVIAAPAAIADHHAAKEGEKVACYGVNKCKGAGDCKTASNACKGHNACKGQGVLEMDKDLCLRLEGGSLTPPKK